MDALQLWSSLCRRGIALAPGPDGIEVTAAKGVITNADRAAVKEHKPALLALLREAMERPRAAMVHAPVLGCDVLAVETEADIPEGHRGPVYTRHELNLMNGLPAADVREIHALKAEWQGSYTGKGDNPAPRDWRPGDRVTGHDGQRWAVGIVEGILPDDADTAPGCAGMVLVQMDGKSHQTGFRPARLWEVTE